MPELGISQELKIWKYSESGTATSNLKPLMNTCSPVMPRTGLSRWSKPGTRRRREGCVGE